MNVTLCNVTDCNTEVTHEVILVLAVDPNHKPATSGPIIKVCACHQDVRFDDVVSEEGWERICRAFIEKKLMAPRKKYSYLEVREIIKPKIEPGTGN